MSSVEHRKEMYGQVENAPWKGTHVTCVVRYIPSSEVIRLVFWRNKPKLNPLLNVNHIVWNYTRLNDERIILFGWPIPSLTNVLCLPETPCIHLQSYWVLCERSLMGKQNGYESKWSEKRKGLQGNATFLWEVERFCKQTQSFVIEGHISLGNAEVLREQAQSLLCKHNLAECISSVSHQDVLRVFCVSPSLLLRLVSRLWRLSCLFSLFLSLRAALISFMLKLQCRKQVKDKRRWMIFELGFRNEKSVPVDEREVSWFIQIVIGWQGRISRLWKHDSQHCPCGWFLNNTKT